MLIRLVSIAFRLQPRSRRYMFQEKSDGRHELSPLPFGFNRVPDMAVGKRNRRKSLPVSIAFRLQPRSRLLAS